MTRTPGRAMSPVVSSLPSAIGAKVSKILPPKAPWQMPAVRTEPERAEGARFGRILAARDGKVRHGRRAQRPLSQERIARAALKLVDRAGLDAFSMHEAAKSSSRAKDTMTAASPRLPR